ncbi:MAG: MMPL family transporter [Myxococcales bacterium]|nr:MMPL family transporter [Myxococcales bacterium]
MMKDLPEKLTRWQLERPSLWILVSAVLGLVSTALVVGVPGVTDGLTLNSDFTAMLPRTAQSVRDMDEISERFGGQQALIVTVQASDIEAVRRFTRDLVPRVEAMQDHKVLAVDWNLHDFEEFVDDNGHLYADLEDLEAIRDALSARLDYERARANPFYIDLDDDPPPDPQETIDRIRRDAESARGDMDERFPEGFFQHPDEPLVLFVVYTSIRGGELGDTEGLVAAIQQAAEELDPDSYAPDLELHFGGALMEAHDETVSLIAAVRNATILTVSLVMLAIWVFFLRIRPIPLLTLALLPPVLVTFGVAELTVDYLNASSAFLSAIVVGNGINPNVIWLARYFEARRAGESLESAILTCHRGTWKGTLTASLAAGVAYGSLMTTDYRGFRDFGIVGGTGMVLCWIAAYTLLPALTVLFERWRPLQFTRTTRYKGFYGVLFAKLALGSPRLVLATSLLVTIASGVLVAYAVIDDPLEYDFRRLRSERDPSSDAELVLQASRAILDDTSSGSGLAVLAPSRDAAVGFRDWLESHRDEFPHAYGEVTSIEDLLPTDQEAKLPVVRELRELMLEIRPHVDEDLQRTIDERIPPADPHAIGPDDLPRSVARPFTERDGTRGRLLVIEHHPEESGWDGHYTARWAAAARALRSPGEDGPPPVAGTAMVFSDLMHQIWDDGPRAIGVAFIATVLLLGLTFRRQRTRWLTLATLLVGIVWMAGTMAAFGMRLNFLNFVAFPITFGNGADYGVNVMRRYADELKRPGIGAIEAIRAAVEGTGGAVILCSLTTIIGYISIYTSSNQALNSFGAAMAISEGTCLAVAVLALPAALYVLAPRAAADREDAGTADARARSV